MPRRQARPTEPPPERIHTSRDRPACSMSTTVTVDPRAVNGQFVRLGASQSRPERRSNSGQPILKSIQMALEPHSDLVLRVGWSYGDSNPRPLACHPAAARPPEYLSAGHRPPGSTRVHSGPPASGPVAVLSCCTPAGPADRACHEPQQPRDQPHPGLRRPRRRGSESGIGQAYTRKPPGSWRSFGPLSLPSLARFLMPYVSATVADAVPKTGQHLILPN